jgi:hypothetical protein
MTNCKIVNCTGQSYFDSGFCYYHHQIYKTKRITRDYPYVPKKIVDVLTDGSVLTWDSESAKD